MPFICLLGSTASLEYEMLLSPVSEFVVPWGREGRLIRKFFKAQ